MRFNFDDEGVQDVGLKFPKVDLKKDEAARGCIISPYFEATVRHWVNRMGYVHCHALRNAKKFKDLLAIQKDGGRPEECLMCSLALSSDTQELVGLPNVHYATYFLRYHTNTRGEILHGQLGYHLEIWLMGAKKYREVMGMKKEWGSLQKYDLELTCTEAKYQNMDISLKKEALWAKADKEQQKQIVEYVKAETEKYPLAECLGESVDNDVLKRRFEVIKRRGFPDDEVNLTKVDDKEEVFVSSPSSSGSEAVGSADDPFGLGGGGEIPSAVTEKEKKSTEEVEDKPSGSLDELIP